MVKGRSILFSTVPSKEMGLKIARELVSKRLVACVNIVPGITSVYRWKGEIQEDGELLLVMKTRTELVEDVRQALVELHEYEVPELVALSLDGGHGPYLEWIDECTS